MTSRVCVAVPTYRRRDRLEALLTGLASVDVDANVCVEVVVFDNDAHGSAESTVRSFAETYPYPLGYECVRDAGLSAVRNVALSYGDSRADYLAMIDDDEVPERQWLSELLRVRRATNADVVVGPVYAILPEGAPRWFEGWRSSEMPMPPDGASMTDGWSGNCLLDLTRLRSFGVTFDPSMNFSGGEDTLFFRQILARGGSIVYAARATAWEFMPAERTSLRFAVARSFRKGNTLAVCDRRIHGSVSAIAVRIAKGCGLAIIGGAWAVGCVLTRQNTNLVKSACNIARGVGMIAGLFGVSYQPYRRST